MIRSAEIGVLFSTSISSRDSGRLFLESLPPAFYPRKFNNFEPINKDFNLESLESALDLWCDGFLWRAKPARTCGSFFSGKIRRRHDLVMVETTVKTLNSLDLEGFFRKLDQLFGIDFAYVFVATDAEYDLGYQYEDDHMKPYQLLLTRDLERGLPNLPWITVFGEPYQRLFGDRLGGVPAHRLASLEKSVFMQLVENPNEISRDFDSFQVVRNAAQDHLGCNAFRATGIRPFNVPEFCFEVN